MGPPCCNKTSLGRSIAARLGCPFLFMEAILDLLPPLPRPPLPQPQAYKNDISSTTQHQHELHKDAIKKYVSKAVDNLFRQAEYLVSTSIHSRRPAYMVLEFPLFSPGDPSPSHLWKFSRFACKVFHSIERILIIDCMPGDIYRWQKKFDERQKQYLEWYYLEESWSDVENTVPQPRVQLDRIFPNEIMRKKVLELEVDPFIDFYFNAKPPALMAEPDHIPEALYEAFVYLLLSRDVQKEGRLRIRMRQWGKERHKLLRLERYSSESSPCLKGEFPHDIIYTMIQSSSKEEGEGEIEEGEAGEEEKEEEEEEDEGEEEEEAAANIAQCGVCTEVITPLSYTYACTSCPLAFHKHCAEIQGYRVSANTTFTFDILSSSDKWETQSSIEFGQDDDEDSQSSDEDDENDYFSYHMRNFLINVKQNRFPVIVYHPLHRQKEDFLHLQIHPEVVRKQCAACGKGIISKVYYYFKGKNICYGTSCIFISMLNRQIFKMSKGHNHFGHLHPLELKFSPNENYEDHICHVCLEERNPRHWYYYCQECDYEAHLYCIIQLDEYARAHFW